jgi:hypothetical protein
MKASVWLWCTVLLLQVGVHAACKADYFTTGESDAAKFGVHEIVLLGTGTVANPFDTTSTVTFVPPSGAVNAKSVQAFYDGGDTWRARIYVSEVGKWHWSSHSTVDQKLSGRSGIFTAQQSKLRGRLLPHSKNARQWMTEDGRWFLNVVDTAYFLLSPKDEQGESISRQDFEHYVRDAVDRGITSFMAYAVPGPACWLEEGNWIETYFADPGCTKLRLASFQNPDTRLRWLLDHYPDVGLELIFFPRGKYGEDEKFWKSLSSAQKERLLRYVVARYAAYPQVFWLVANDSHYGPQFPNNNAYVREVGGYFKNHDAWRHPMSTGHARRIEFFFGKEDWATYLHLEHEYDLGAEQYAKYRHHGKPVLLGEDRYEQYLPKLDPTDMRYYQRRLYWTWLLSDGMANYGGRWWVLHPYSETGSRSTSIKNSSNGPILTFSAQLTGLDSVRFIRDYFVERGIELSDFEPDHVLVKDSAGAGGIRAPKLMSRGHEEFLIYHPNAAADGKEARVDRAMAPGVVVNLLAAQGQFKAEWYRTSDGISETDEDVTGGKEIQLTAPWTGHDVLLRLVKSRTE